MNSKKCIAANVVNLSHGTRFDAVQRHSGNEWQGDSIQMKIEDIEDAVKYWRDSK